MKRRHAGWQWAIGGVALLWSLGGIWAQSVAFSVEQAIQMLTVGLSDLPAEPVEVGLLPHLPLALRQAMEALAQAGEQGIAALARFLHHPRPAARMWIAHTLGESGRPQAGGALRRALRDAQPAVRVEAARALGYCGDVGALPDLEQALQSESQPAVLAALRSARALLRQIQEVQQRTPADRLAGWLALLRYRFAIEQVVAYGREAVPALLPLLTSGEQAQAAGAAVALARLADERGIQPLLQQALATRRSYYAQALALYESPAVWEALLQLLGSDDFSLEYWALRGMDRWRLPGTQAALLAYLERRMARNWHRKPMIGDHIPVNTLGEACRLLAEVGDGDALPLLRRLITESPSGQNLVHEAAIEAFKRVNARVRQTAPAQSQAQGEQGTG